MQVLPSLACAIGLEDAIVLQQFHYWLLRTNPDAENIRWVPASMERLREKFPFLARRSLERVIARLEAGGMLRSSRPNRAKHDQTKHYTIVYECVPGQIESANLADQESASLAVSTPSERRDVLSSSESKREQKEEKTETLTRARARRERFERFWKAYPKKLDKGHALAAFDRLDPDDALVNLMIAALEQQRTWPDWQRDDGRWIPYAQGWITGRRWEDERPALQPDAELEAVRARYRS